MIIAPVVMLATTLQDVDGAALYKRVLPSIATLSVVHKDGKSSLGTGFLAYKPGLMVTAWHVVENAKSVTAKFSDGEEFECTGIVDKDISRDVAIIRVKAVGKPLLAVADEKPDVGAKAFIVGAPRGLDFSISDGIISQIDTLEGKKIIQYTCPTSPGNSGGPLLDSSGKVRGVVSFLLKDSQNLNFAIPISYVSGFDLSLATVSWNEVTTSPSMSVVSKKLNQDDFDKLAIEVIRLSRTADLVRRSFPFLLRADPTALNNGPTAEVIATYRSLMKFEAEHKGDVFDTNMPALKDAQLLINKWVQVYENMITSLEKFQRRDVESASFQRLSDVMISELENDDFAKAYKEYVYYDKSFQTKRPIGHRAYNQTFISGIEVFPANPKVIVLVYDDSFAKKVGLQIGDTMLSTDRGAVNDVTDLENIIVANLGNTVKVKVLRNNKERELNMKIPKQIPQEYKPKS